MSVDIIAKLDELASLQASAAVLRLDYRDRRAEILSAIQPQLDDLDRELKPGLEAADLKEAQLQDEIKALVIGQGESVKGAKLHAVYAPGRVTWDTKRLDGFSLAHPELASFRKVGAPSVTIRPAK